MEKLKSEHLVPYLPYSLKVVMEGEKTNVAWMSTKNIAVIIPHGIGEFKKIKWEYAHLNIKPILKPLSDLAKEIDNDNRNITYFAEIGIYSKNSRDYILKHPTSLGYEQIIKLFEWHFDVFGLIPKKLAIDINTI